MDLKKLERWTRDELEAEAKRLGARGARALSRSELVRVIVLRMKAGGAWSKRAARWAERVPGMRWASRALGTSDEAPRASDASEPARPPAEPSPYAAEDSASASAPAPAPTPPGSRAAAARMLEASHHAVRTEEPIRTRSMARLLAAQGHRERALEVYEALLRAQPHDASLRHEAAALRAEPDAAPASHAPSLPRPPSGAMSGGEDHVRGERLDGGRARVWWRVTEEGRRRAQQVLGGEGDLVLRTVLLSADPTTVVRSRTREEAVDLSEGERTLEGVAPDDRAFVAVGLRHHGRFAAIAHVAL